MVKRFIYSMSKTFPVEQINKCNYTQVHNIDNIKMK